MSYFKKHNAIVAFFSFISGVLAGMRGGQKDKIVRRAGVPLTILGFSLFVHFRWRYLALLLLFIPLSMGYGVDSHLGSLLGHTEWAIRAVYALLVSFPFLVFGWIRWAITAILLILAYQVHAGSLGHIDWFGDLLIEDIIRFSTIMGCAIVNIIIDWRRYESAKSKEKN